MAEFTVLAASKKKDVPDAKFGPAQVIALTLKNGDGDAKQAEWFTKATTALPAEGSKLEGDLEEGQYGLKFKKAKSGNFGGGTGGSYNDPETVRRITRSHSQEMAIRTLDFMARAGVLDLEQLRSVGVEHTITKWTDHFDADVGVGGGMSSGSRGASKSPGAVHAQPAADSNANGEGASDAQRQFLFGGGGKGPGLFARAKLSDSERTAILHWAGEPLNGKAASRLIELLKDDPEKAGRALVADLERKAQEGDEKAAAALLASQSDVPADVSDLVEPVPPSEPVTAGADDLFPPEPGSPEAF